MKDKKRISIVAIFLGSIVVGGYLFAMMLSCSVLQGLGGAEMWQQELVGIGMFIIPLIVIVLFAILLLFVSRKMGISPSKRIVLFLAAVFIPPLIIAILIFIFIWSQSLLY